MSFENFAPGPYGAEIGIVTDTKSNEGRFILGAPCNQSHLSNCVTKLLNVGGRCRCFVLALQSIKWGDLLYIDYGRSYDELAKDFVHVDNIKSLWPSLC